MGKKKALTRFVFCLFAGMLCACHREQEADMTVTPAPDLTAPPENTKVPSVTEEPGSHPTAVPTREPSPTPVPEGERIPIDEAHFTSADFRKVISENYDTDGDGYLSDTEREAVLTISWTKDVLPEGELQDGFQVIDGLGYFPNLRFLSAGRAGQIIIKDHPSIRGVRLARESFLYAGNCPAFCSLFSYWINSNLVYISKAAPDFFWEEHWGETYQPGSGQFGKRVLDGELVVCMGTKLPRILSGEKGGSGFYEELPVQWLEQTEGGVILLEEFWKDYFVGKEIDFYGVSVSAWEEDRKGYPPYFGEGQVKDVMEDSQGKKKWLLSAYDPDPMSDETSNGIVCYAEEMPEAEKIKLRIGENSKVFWLDHSEERTLLTLRYELEFWYQDGGAEKKIGGLEEMSCPCIIRKDGAVFFSMEDYMKDTEFSEEPEPDKEVIPVDVAHFSSGIFRRYLECFHNIDAKEGLSLKERGSVQVLNFEGLFRFSGETLDGLEYFPKLTDLYPGYAGTLVVENHPSLEVIGGDAPGLKKLVVRNCPELRRIDLDLSKIEEVVIEGCGKLDELIPIDEAHFTSEAFREYIYETYDKDRDGMLSAKEREAVKEIDLQSFGEMRFLNETLDGFEQFPCLEAVLIGLTGKVIIQGHPAIKFFGGTENAVQEVIIADCPALERIGFYLSDLGNISVKNCPELKEFSVENGNVDNADTVWEFLGTPRLIFDSDTAPGRLVLDADAALRAYYGTYQPEFFTFDEERQLCYCGTRVEWVNRSEINMPASVSPEIEQQLEEKALQIYRLVSIVEGRKNNRLAVLKKLSEDAPVYVRFYSEKEQPEFKDFSFSCDGKAVIDVYSPNRAVTQHWEGWISLVYEEDGEKQELFHWKEKTAPITLFADGSTMEYDSWNQWMGMSTGTAEELEEGIRQGLEDAAKYGGNFGLGSPSPEIIRSFAGLSGVRQVVSDYPFECAILLEDGTMFSQSHLNGDARFSWEGAALKEIAVPETAGAAAGITEDGTFVFQPTGWEREKKLKEWPERLRQICAGHGLVGLTEDGTVIAEEAELDYIINTVERWSGISRVAARGGTVIGLKEDGTVVAACTLGNNKGQCAAGEWSDIVAVGTNGRVTIGIKKDGSVVTTEEAKCPE